MPFGVIGAAIGTYVGGVGVAGVIGGAVGGLAGNYLASQTDGGIAGALGIGQGGGSSAPSATQGGYANGSYVPPYQQQAAQQEFNTIGALSNTNYNPYAQFGAQYGQQTAQAAGLTSEANAWGQRLDASQDQLTGQVNQLSNNYLQSGQQGAYQQNMNGLTPQYQAQGQQGLNMSGQLAGQINPTLNAANRVLDTAFDPQSALYNRTQHQLDQQTAANQASRGLAMTPYGAELSNQADSNFNIDWQNAQLSRQTAGVSAYTGANASASQMAQGANQSGAAGLGNMNTGAGLSYNTAQQIYGNNQTALQNQQGAQNASQATHQQAFQNQTSALGAEQGALQNQQNNFQTNAGMLQQQITDYNTYQGLGSPSAQIAQANNSNAASGMQGQAMGGLASGLSSAVSQGIAGWGQSTPSAQGYASQGYSQQNPGAYSQGSPYNPYSTGSLYNGGGDSSIPGATGFSTTNPYGPTGLTNGGYGDTSGMGFGGGAFSFS